MIKLGQSRLEEDRERIAAVRKIIGPDRVFMVDANMGWTVETVLKAVELMAPYNIYWLEEPTIPDDFFGYARIAEKSSIPIAMGEDLHRIYEHRYAMAHADYLEVHSFPIDEYTPRPLVLKKDRAYAPDTTGTGVEFDWKKMGPYKTDL